MFWNDLIRGLELRIWTPQNVPPWLVCDLCSFHFQFLGVLNSKKKKLRELRDKLSKQGAAVEEPVEEDTQSTDRTETFDVGSNEEISGEEVEKEDIGTSSSKDVPARRGRGRGRGRKRK